VVTITHKEMTRFTLTIEEAINFVLNCSCDMVGGEIFVPKLPSYNILQLARVVAPNADINVIGIRPGEKLHEMMIGDSEGYLTIECDDKYIIRPVIPVKAGDVYVEKYGDRVCDPDFTYSSGKNPIIENEVLSGMVSEYEKKLINQNN